MKHIISIQNEITKPPEIAFSAHACAKASVSAAAASVSASETFALSGDCYLSDKNNSKNMLVEEEDAEGVLKMNSKILDTSELKKLDKQEKYAVQDLHNTEKGRLKRVDESLWPPISSIS